MYALFEDAGKFLGGRVMSEADASCQIELDTGKRQKVKTANVLLRFESPLPKVLLLQAEELAQAIDLDFAWEVLGEEEFSFSQFAHEYFSTNASLVEQAGALLGLHNAPHYFRRAGKGRFKKVPAEILKQALLAIEKRKEQAALVDLWVHQLTQGECPAPVQQQLYKILFKPDKNALEYKAVAQAARSSGQAVLPLLQNAGAIRSPFQFHWQRFLLEHFPRGTDFPVLPRPLSVVPQTATVGVFSVDDSATTEIDDAFSVEGLGTGEVCLGIHIAAPGLGVAPGDANDAVARTRMSTVYMPGHKITMLPPAVVDEFTLVEGRCCPSVSLYIRLKEDDLTVLASETRVDWVQVQANLRYDHLEDWATETNLGATAWDLSSLPSALKGVSPQKLAFLYRLARHLNAQRMVARGRPETSNRPDFNFRLIGIEGDEPNGGETVEISVRKRGAPLDLLVAEAMILANNTWGQWLAQSGVPGIYRSQAALAKGIKVKMGSRPLPHAGMGVACYAWCTSPLRRYVDLVNQWQLIACIKHGATAALVAPFKPKDASLLAVIATFEETYAAYNAVQRQMELYWTLQYMEQKKITQLLGVVIKEGLARANDIPLVVSLVGGMAVAPGQMVKLQMSLVDRLLLNVTATVVERLEVIDSQTAIEDDFEEATELPSLPVALELDLDAQEQVRGDEAAQQPSMSSETPHLLNTTTVQ